MAIDLGVFLNTLFAPIDVDQEKVLLTWPAHFKKDGIRRDYFKQVAAGPDVKLPADCPLYYCVSSVRPVQFGSLKRRSDDLVSSYVLALDDIGTKAAAPEVEPSYILETSAGNYQYGYLLEPFHVTSPEARDYYDGCLLGMAQAGYNDYGCRSANRVMRVPGAVHSTGFVAEVTAWNPGVRWKLQDLMAEFGVSPALVNSGRARKPGKHTELGDVDDVVYQWLVSQGLVRGDRDNWVHIPCPWAHEHSDPKDDEAGYSPLDYVTAGRGFHCFHSHDYTAKDFLAWVFEQGGPSIDPTYERLRRVLECI